MRTTETMRAMKKFLTDNYFNYEVVVEGKEEFPKTILESQNGSYFETIEEMEDVYDATYYDNGTFKNHGFRTFVGAIQEEFPEAEILFNFEDRQDMSTHVEITKEFCIEFPEFFVYGFKNPGEKGIAKIIKKREASRSRHQELEKERPRR